MAFCRSNGHLHWKQSESHATQSAKSYGINTSSYVKFEMPQTIVPSSNTNVPSILIEKNGRLCLTTQENELFISVPRYKNKQTVVCGSNGGNIFFFNLRELCTVAFRYISCDFIIYLKLIIFYKYAKLIISIMNKEF